MPDQRVLIPNIFVIMAVKNVPFEFEHETIIIITHISRKEEN